MKKGEDLRVEVQIEEGPENPKGEILTIHGWPDSSEMWNKQTEYFKKDYRIINVTIPLFGKESNAFNMGKNLCSDP